MDQVVVTLLLIVKSIKPFRSLQCRSLKMGCLWPVNPKMPGQGNSEIDADHVVIRPIGEFARMVSDFSVDGEPVGEAACIARSRAPEDSISQRSHL